MVAASSSAKAGCGTAAKNSARGAENRRVPAMQFVRTAFAIAREDDAARSETSFDPSAASKAKVDDGARDGLESGAGGSAGAGWTVAVSSPMSVLQAFALAVIGLETSIVGASVRVVDRSAVSAETEREAAAGFTGFDEVCPPWVGHFWTFSAMTIHSLVQLSTSRFLKPTSGENRRGDPRVGISQRTLPERIASSKSIVLGQ